MSNNNMNNRVMKVKTKQKLSPVRNVDVDYDPDKRLKGSFNIAIVSPSGSIQFAVHNPIGNTDYNDQYAFMTEVPRMQSLLGRAKTANPEILNKAISEERAKILNRHLIKVKFGDQEKYCYKQHISESRFDVLKRAEQDMKSDKKEQLAVFLDENPNKKVSSFKYGKTKQDFLPENFRKVEIQIQNDYQSDEFKQKVRLAELKYATRTRKGPLNNIEQRPFCASPNLEDAHDKIVQLCTFLSLGYINLDKVLVNARNQMVKDTAKIPSPYHKLMKGVDPPNNTEYVMTKTDLDDWFSQNAAKMGYLSPKDAEALNAELKAAKEAQPKGD